MSNYSSSQYPSSGRNPLHLAAMNNYTQTVELLHSVHSHLLDQVDKDGVIMKFMDFLFNSITSTRYILCKIILISYYELID